MDNDAAGVTAEFNLNVLRVLNRELGANFESEGFEHDARFNAAASQIEMYLVSQRDQFVDLGGVGARIRIDAGERILTEISRKFTRESLETLLETAGFNVAHHYEPSNAYFSLVLARR